MSNSIPLLYLYQLGETEPLLVDQVRGQLEATLHASFENGDGPAPLVRCVHERFRDVP